MNENIYITRSASHHLSALRVGKLCQLKCCSPYSEQNNHGSQPPVQILRASSRILKLLLETPNFVKTLRLAISRDQTVQVFKFGSLVNTGINFIHKHPPAYSRGFASKICHHPGAFVSKHLPWGRGFVGTAPEGRAFVYKRCFPFLKFSL